MARLTGGANMSSVASGADIEAGGGARAACGGGVVMRVKEEVVVVGWLLFSGMTQGQGPPSGPVQVPSPSVAPRMAACGMCAHDGVYVPAAVASRIFAARVPGCWHCGMRLVGEGWRPVWPGVRRAGCRVQGSRNPKKLLACPWTAIETTQHHHPMPPHPLLARKTTSPASRHAPDYPSRRP
jgi:hypothetical protein